MSIKPFIFKNNTDEDIIIHDLSGIHIPASGIVNVEDMFTNYTVYESWDLKTLISGSQIIINNGSEDLSIEDGLIYCSYEIPIDQIPGTNFDAELGTYSMLVGGNEYVSISKFTALKDTPSSYIDKGNFVVKVKSNESGLEFFDHNTEFPFGTYYFYNNDETCSSTTSINWQQKLKLSIYNLPYGNYRMGYYYEWHESSTSSQFVGRVQIDDNTTISEVNFTPSDSSVDRYHPVSGFFITTFSGSHFVDIDFRSADAGKEATIRRARIEIWRIN